MSFDQRRIHDRYNRYGHTEWAERLRQLELDGVRIQDTDRLRRQSHTFEDCRGPLAQRQEPGKAERHTLRDAMRFCQPGDDLRWIAMVAQQVIVEVQIESRSAHVVLHMGVENIRGVPGRDKPRALPGSPGLRAQRLERCQPRGGQHAQPGPFEEGTPLPLRCDVLHCHPTFPFSAAPRAVSVCSSPSSPISKARTMWGSYPVMACILLYTDKLPKYRDVEAEEGRRAFSDNCGDYSSVSAKNGGCIALTSCRSAFLSHRERVAH